MSSLFFSGTLAWHCHLGQKLCNRYLAYCFPSCRAKKKQRQLCLCNKVILKLLKSSWKHWVSYIYRSNTPAPPAWKGWILACCSGTPSNQGEVEGNQIEEVEEPVSNIVTVKVSNWEMFHISETEWINMAKLGQSIFRREFEPLLRISNCF